jgi:hypothetical protein
LKAENAALRHQLIVLQRKVRGRVHLTNSDRLLSLSQIRSAHIDGNPPRTGRLSMRPMASTARRIGASLSKDRCVRVSLEYRWYDSST